MQLTREQALFERMNVIDKFEDRRGSSKILLASMNGSVDLRCLDVLW